MRARSSFLLCVVLLLVVAVPLAALLWPERLSRGGVRGYHGAAIASCCCGWLRCGCRCLLPARGRRQKSNNNKQPQAKRLWWYFLWCWLLAGRAGAARARLAGGACARVRYCCCSYCSCALWCARRADCCLRLPAGEGEAGGASGAHPARLVVVVVATTTTSIRTRAAAARRGRRAPPRTAAATNKLNNNLKQHHQAAAARRRRSEEWLARRGAARAAERSQEKANNSTILLWGGGAVGAWSLCVVAARGLQPPAPPPCCRAGRR